jgi:hypothetical protein
MMTALGKFFAIALASATLLLAVDGEEQTRGQRDASAEPRLGRVRVSDDGRSFVVEPSEKRLMVWGVNYDHDGSGRLLEEYWREEWSTVVEDFREIKALGANVVRIHLQVASFLDAPKRPNAEALARLRKLLQLAEETGLYLDVTGLACYHGQAEWYVKLSEARRWDAQVEFWDAIARTCRESSAVFCYDLMNEPILPGKGKPEENWLAGKFAGKHFVQRIALDLGGRTRKEVARAWVERLVGAIRRHDPDRLITVGVIPWATVFPKAKPLFYSAEVGEKLDFVSVHFYPEKGKVDAALRALRLFEVGKPIVIEEIFPLKCGPDELLRFIDASRRDVGVDGWVSFYWGTTPEEYAAKAKPTIADSIARNWIERFRQRAPGMVEVSPNAK